MKTILGNAILIVILSGQLFSQSESIISVSSGVSKAHGNGYGILSDYQFSIAEKMYFTVGAGYFRWADSEGNTRIPYAYDEESIIAKKISFAPFNVGVKYYFGDRGVMPYVSTCWAFNISTIHLHKYFNEARFDERIIAEVTYSLGIGCLYVFNEDISGQFEFAPYFGGKYSQGVRFSLGAAYLIQ